MASILRKVCCLNTQKYFPITDRKPEEIIAIRTDGEIRVDQFLAEAKALSIQLPDHRYVFNLFADRYQYLLGFCASVIAGQCTLMPPNRLTKTLEYLASEFPDNYSLGGSDLPDNEMLRDSYHLKPAERDNNEIPMVPAAQLCATAFTSGSTGTPMPNLKYWETLRTGSIGNAELLLKKLKGRMNLVVTVPPQHMWGLETSILLPLFANAAISQLAPFYPQDIADALETLPAPRALISSPVHLNFLLKSGVRLVKLDRILSATAPLAQKSAKELEYRFNTQVIEVFGSSESGILASRHTATETLWRLSDLFEIDVKENGVLIRGQHLPEEVVLQDVIEKSGESRFRWLGRHHDMVNIAGKQGSLVALNRCLLAIQDVVDGVIFIPENNPERLAALVVAPNLKPADILDELKSEIESVFLPRPVYMVSALPRQETGKLTTKDVMKLFEDIMKVKKTHEQKP